MKFFIAGSWEDRDMVEKLTHDIWKKFGNWNSTTSWWKHEDKGLGLAYAYDDKENLRKADIFIIYNTDRKSTGKIVELGMAIAWDKPIFVYGKPISGVYETFTKYMGEWI